MTISFSVAFFSGVVSFFAPCVLPLLPAYIAYVTGVSLKELKEKGMGPFRKRIIISSIAYVVGFSLVFTLLGSTAAGVGVIFRQHARLIQIFGGLLMIIFGLEFAGILRLPALARERRFSLPNDLDSEPIFRAFLLGMIFAVTWSPCVGAVLGSIYALAAISGSAVYGAALLFVYSLGITIPFLLVSFTLMHAPKYLTIITKRIGLLSRVAGLVLAFLGILLVTGYYAEFNAFLFNIAYRLGYKVG